MVISCVFAHFARLTEEIVQRNSRDELGATEKSLNKGVRGCSLSIDWRFTRFVAS